MPPFRPPKERLDRLATLVLDALQKAPGCEVKIPELTKGVVRATLAVNLLEEHTIEEEAMTLLKAHGQAVYEAKADFQKLLHEGKKVLAKKKGFIL